MFFASPVTSQPGAPRGIGAGYSGAFGQHLVFSAYNTQADIARVPVMNSAPGSGGGVQSTGTITPTPSTRGLVPAFDGSASIATVKVPNLPRRITLSWWQYKASFLSSQRTAFCFKTTGSDVAASNGFFFAPDYASNRMTAFVGYGSGSSFTRFEYAQPSTGWHHFMMAFDRDQPGAAIVYLMMDGVALTKATDSSVGTRFAADWGAGCVLEFGGENGASSFCACQLANFHIFNCALNADNARILYLESTRLMRPFLRRSLIPATSGSTGSAGWFFGA